METNEFKYLLEEIDFAFSSISKEEQKDYIKSIVKQSYSLWCFETSKKASDIIYDSIINKRSKEFDEQKFIQD